MYYLRNETTVEVEEEIEVDGIKRVVKLFANETIYNIEAEQISLSKLSVLSAGSHPNKVITAEMEAHFAKYRLERLREHLRYRLVEPEVSKKVIVVLGEMSLQGHNANLQYIYTPFNKFIESAFQERATIISLVDTKNAVGDIYRVDDNELKLLKQLIEQQLEKHRLTASDLFFVGSSIGGTAAILLATDYPQATVISSMPVLRAGEFCIDNLSRKAVYFITSNFEEDIVNRIIPENDYYIYCGSVDLTAHHNLHLDMLLGEPKDNIKISIVNDGHAATRRFKNELLYRIDKTINDYQREPMKVDEWMINVKGNNLQIRVQSEVVLGEAMCPLIALTSPQKTINYKAEFDMEAKEYYVEGSVCLAEGFSSDELASGLSVQLIIADYQSKREYYSKVYYQQLNPKLDHQLLRAKGGQIKPSYYYYNHNLLTVEFELATLTPVLFARLLVSDHEQNEYYHPLETKSTGDRVALILNERRPIVMPRGTFKMWLQIIDCDYQERRLEVIVQQGCKKNVN